MDTAAHRSNILFQSEEHPLVLTHPKTLAEHVLSLIHAKAYKSTEGIVAGRRVLDVGCNNGYGARLMSAWCDSIVGVDVSEAAIREATAVQSDPKIRFRLIDGVRLPFDDASFDVVTSFQVIEHVVDVDRYLSEIGRVLKPGGQAVFTTPNRKIRLDPGMAPWNPFHVREYTAEEIGETLRSSFSNVVLRGLFAEPGLYDVEYNRVQKERNNARRGPLVRRIRRLMGRAAHAVREAAGTVSSGPLTRWLRAPDSEGRAGRAATAGRSVARWSLDDLHYKETDLDAALDLMAICVKAEPPKS